jgi:formylglycine-generating enzyme required for sulfatase activity
MAVDIEDTNFTPGLLQPNTTYFWQVNATDSNGFSNTGPVWIFTTTSDSILVPGEMVVIPAGNFQMGCDPNHNGGEPCYSSALPVHTVYLDTYQIDKYEVTNGQYALCVAAGECDSPYYNSSESQTSYFNNPDYENYPVIWVDWYKANAYCTWAGKRLPTEAEWEKAARGSVSIVAYPWGDASPTIDWDATGDHRRCDHSNFEYVCENGDTSEIGSYPSGASPYRLLDMSGNVWEWVSDWVSSSYYSESPLSNPAGPAFGANKGLRGGSFLTFDDGLTASRGSRSPSTKASHIGFRCAASME